MTNLLSPETLKIDMGESTERFSVNPDNYLENIRKVVKAFGQIGFSCEELKKLQWPIK